MITPDTAASTTDLPHTWPCSTRPRHRPSSPQCTSRFSRTPVHKPFTSAFLFPNSNISTILWTWFECLQNKGNFRKAPTVILNLFIGGVKVERVTEYKHLGTVLENKLKFNKNTHFIDKRCQPRIFCLQKLRSLNPFVSPPHQLLPWSLLTARRPPLTCHTPGRAVLRTFYR